LVLSDSSYPGWEVSVDGKKQELLTADVGLRGVFLKKGTHLVEFTYVPKVLYSGMIISAVTFVVVLLIIITHDPYAKAEQNKTREL